MFRATLALFSKASRAPLTSKKANKDFYKGTRTGNIMLRKRIALADRQGRQIYDKNGKPKTWNLRGTRIDDSLLTSYVVPPGLLDTELKPYVFNGDPADGGVPAPRRPGVPGGPKMGRTGFDGAYYAKIRDEVVERRQAGNSDAA